MRVRSLVRNFLYVFIALMMVLPAVSLAQPARVEAATQAEIDTALAKGCAWLVTQQQLNGSWLGGYAADTGFAVATLEHYAEQLGTTPLNSGYIYHTQVQKGLDYLLANATRDNVGHDWVYWNVGGNNAYQTGPCLMGIARSGAPTATVVGGALAGMTYKAVAQAAVDWLYSAQVPSGINIGAWYYVKGSPTTDGDQSATGWATMGLGYAQNSMGCIIPAGLLTNLALWNEYIQTHTVGSDFGGAGYTEPGYWVNVYKTGHLLFAQKLCGSTLITPRVQEALTYLNTHWGDLSNDPGWRGNPPGTRPSYIATIAATKGFTEMGITTFSGHNWYNDFADVLVAQQKVDGHWEGGGHGEYSPWVRSTCWALMTLLKAHSAPPPPVCTVTAVDPAYGQTGQTFDVTIKGTNFSGATSVSFGPGITVNSFTVNSDSKITANITITTGAVGAMSVTVITPVCRCQLTGGFMAIPLLPNKTGGSGGAGTIAAKPYIPPVFVVQNATVAASKAGPGEQVEVTATVTNNGGSNGTTKVILYVNGQEADSKGIALSSGQSTPVSFKVSRNDPGTYSV
ncbi:MAG: hypothetical protein NT177_02925, partial [Chloroflexi bacterium]|nr:hypothetical protein [Chloroflexota bacterium]